MALTDMKPAVEILTKATLPLLDSMVREWIALLQSRPINITIEIKLPKKELSPTEQQNAS